MSRTDEALPVEAAETNKVAAVETGEATHSDGTNDGRDSHVVQSGEERLSPCLRGWLNAF